MRYMQSIWDPLQTQVGHPFLGSYSVSSRESKNEVSIIQVTPTNEVTEKGTSE